MGAGWGRGRRVRKGWRHASLALHLPGDHCFIFVTSSVPEVAGVTKTVQKIAPLPRPRKLKREVTSQKSSRPVPWPMWKGLGL